MGLVLYSFLLVLMVGQCELGWRGSGLEGHSFHGAVSQDKDLICSGVSFRHKYRVSRGQGPPSSLGVHGCMAPATCPRCRPQKPSLTEPTDPGSR